MASRQRKGGNLLGVAWVMVAAVGLGSATAACDPGAVDGAPDMAETTAMIRIGPGANGTDLITALGPPTNRRALKNDQPGVMGATVLDYVFSAPVIRFLDKSGSILVEGAAMQVVLDQSDTVLRVVMDPNRPGPSGSRTQLGARILPCAAEVPVGAVPLHP